MAASGRRRDLHCGWQHLVVMAFILGMFRGGRDDHARDGCLGVSSTFCHNAICLNVVEGELGVERPRRLRGGGLGGGVGGRLQHGRLERVV